MLKQIIISTAIVFAVLLMQFFIIYLFAREKNKIQIKEIVLSFLGASLFIGLAISLLEFLFQSVNYKIIYYVLAASLISAYWFIVEPLKFLFFRGDRVRGKELEKKLTKKGYNYKILFSDAITNNAYATGIVPFCRVIILGSGLKKKLTPSQLEAIVYHEIGHHERYHILKLFLINVVLQVVYLQMFSLVFRLPDNIGLLEPLIVACVGGAGGLVFWFVPNKVSLWFEYYADKYAAVHYSREVIIESLQRLDEISGGSLTRGNYSHPKLEKRVRNIIEKNI
ncbi:MAG: M48 family metalloprotease [Bacteroidales bacterium]